MAEKIVQIYKDKEHLHKEYPITVPEAIKMPDGRTLALDLEQEKQKLEAEVDSRIGAKIEDYDREFDSKEAERDAATQIISQEAEKLTELEQKVGEIVESEQVLGKDDYATIANQYIFADGSVGGHGSMRLRTYSAVDVVSVYASVYLNADTQAYAIAFYNSTSLTPSTFMASASVARTAAQAEYNAQVPEGCVTIAIVNREDIAPTIRVVKKVEGSLERLTGIVDDHTEMISSSQEELRIMGECFNKDRYGKVVIDGTPVNNGNAAYYPYNASSPSSFNVDSTLFRAKLYAVDPSKTYYVDSDIVYTTIAMAVFFDANGNYLGYQNRGTSSRTSYRKEQIVFPSENVALMGISSHRDVPIVAYVDSKIYSVKGVSDWRGLKWACMGDSLTAVGYTDKHYYDYVAELTGIVPINLGIGGTGYAKSNPFYNRVSTIPSDADVITIFGSGNDLSAGKPIGDVIDNTDATLCGCINLAISGIQAAFPLVPLGIITPTPWVNNEPNNPSSGFIAYCKAIVDICALRGVPCLDLYHCSNLHPSDASFRALVYTTDDSGGVHPNEIGHKIIAPRFKALLESLLM